MQVLFSQTLTRPRRSWSRPSAHVHHLDDVDARPSVEQTVAISEPMMPPMTSIFFGTAPFTVRSSSAPVESTMMRRSRDEGQMHDRRTGGDDAPLD